MGKSGANKENLSKHGETSIENACDGTAARTRPLSFDEIMRRRKNKELPERVSDETLVTGKIAGDGIPENLADGRESGGWRHRHSNNDHEKLPAEEPVDNACRKKGGSNSVNEDSVSKQRKREDQRLATSRKLEMNNGMSSKAREMSNERTSSGKKMDNRAGNVFENEAPRKRLRSLVVMGVPRDESDRKTEKENKIKYRNGEELKVEDRRIVNKHDLEKAHDLRISERDEKRERSKLHHDDLGAKRRRSRSRDLLQGRNRSRSLSPRVRKITTHGHREHETVSSHSHTHRPREHETLSSHSLTHRHREHETLSSYSVTHRHREHDALSSHSLKERPGRHNPDTDRNRRSKHSSSGSGLGGYSPRKRRVEAPVKTQSPPKHLPEKKTPKWDLTPAVTDSILSAPVFPGLQSALQQQPLTISSVTLSAVEPLMSLRMLPIKQNADAVQLTESTRPMRRLYVENLPDSASEKSLRECLNSYLLSSGFNHIQGSEPCISCIINKEKGQALAEFLTPEDASSALSFDGHSFAGSALKIRRPKDFVDVATSKPEKSQATMKVSTQVAADALSQIAPNVLSDNVEDSPNKIFIGGISKALSPELLREIANVFGPLKAYRFELNEDLGEPFAFLEYVDPSTTLKACGGLNGMKLGGKTITAVQAFPNLLLVNNEKQPFYGIPEHAKPLLSEPTPVLKLKNLFDQECFTSLSEPEMEGTLEDVRLECSRFGSVKSINVVKPEMKSIAASGACVDDHAKAGSDESVTDRGTSPLPEPQREEINTLDARINDKESERANNILEHDSTVDDDEPCKPHSSTAGADVEREGKTEAILGESTNLVITSKIEPDRGVENLRDNNPDNDVGIKTEENGSDLDDATGKSLGDKSGPRCNDVIAEKGPLETSDGTKEQDRDLARIFEPGCVFVEFRRSEASCTAAYCLHGRLFDKRTVAVEYVNLDDYRTRFRK